jgi:type I restriction enzyme S subunit
MISSLSVGTIQRQIKNHLLRVIQVATPPLDDQQKIVSFLDTETTRIDKLISKQQKLIELLEEQRKSIISHTVTKGLNPNAPMKDSGVEWLGEVPEGWEVYPFWHLFKRKEITNKTEEQLLSVYLDRGVILHSEGGGMVHKPAENLEKYQLVEVNDFVMNNQQAWRGSVGVSPHQGIVSPAYLIFKPNKELNSQFSKYQLRDKYLVDQFMISSLSVGTIQRQIKNHLLRVIQVATPPLDDQQKIVSFLDTETARIDNLISKQKMLIEKLKEYRSSIISHAVTGKIDVRHHASHPTGNDKNIMEAI